MLTDIEIRTAKQKEKPYKLADTKGLYLLVNQAGKYFRFDYRFRGKRKTLALGVYPEVSLARARDLLLEARKMLNDGLDPADQRRVAKAKEAMRAANSFEAVAREWFSKYKSTWTESYSQSVMRRLEINAFPFMGNRPIAEIAAPELLAVLRRIESRGVIETAHRIQQICGQVFRYAVATGRTDRDPSGDLRGALTPSTPKHMAAITDPKKIGGLIRAINGYDGHIITKCALRLAPLLFVRPGELRRAEWGEINIDQAEWKIPAEKMKMRSPHIIPLSLQAVQVFREIMPFTGKGRYIFPSMRSTERPMSENTILAALRRMGYAKEEMSGHGFRAMASTILHEQGWPSDVIERQLAHQERNKVKASYNHVQHLDERRKMMQAWADYLDSLAKGADIIPIFAKAR